MDSCISYLKSPALTSLGSIANYSRLDIRAARQKDLSSLSTVLAESFHPPEGWVRWVYPVLRLGIYEDLRHRLASGSPHYLCLVASIPKSGLAIGEEEELIGTVEMTLRSPYFPHAGSQYLYVSNLAVSKPYRRKGVARELLLDCEQKALEWGFQELYLHVLENNHQAKQLYFKVGYKLYRVEPSCSAFFFQSPHRLFLRKYLV